MLLKVRFLNEKDCRRTRVLFTPTPPARPPPHLPCHFVRVRHTFFFIFLGRLTEYHERSRGFLHPVGAELEAAAGVLGAAVVVALHLVHHRR